jgi:hypothetical protein
MVPNLVSNGVLDIAGAAAFTALIVQQTKFLIELFIKPTNSNHDSVMRLYVNAVAMIVVVVAEIVAGTMNVHNGAAWFSALTAGFGVGLAAISGYHLLNGMDPQTKPAAKPETSTQPPADNGTSGNGVHTTPLPGLQSIATPATTPSASTPAGGTVPVANNSTLHSVDMAAAPGTDSPAARTAAVGDTNVVRIADRGDGTLASWILQARMPLAE